jgi:hypothetical protein
MIKVKVTDKKGKAEYPADHKPGMRVTKGGSMCKNCEYVSGNKCTNEYFIKWHGNDIIPAPIDEYCSDFWEPKD